jgi:DNA-binding LytR/AlgR family response regulator
VESVEREGQRTLLLLTDGRRVPVGRSFRPALKAAGWL